MKITSHTLRSTKTNDDEIFENFRHESEWTRSVPSITEFYAGREIFITGGTGFMGKVLIEKLLRSCSDLKAIFVLLRSKKGKSIDQRLSDLISLPLFQPLRNHRPEVLEKLIPIDGNVAEKSLAISQHDRDRMKNVSIIFHSAASVRFDDPLKYAVFINTRGTHEVLKFAKTLKNIKVVMHVSTTYSHPELKTVGEVIHKPYFSWKKSIEICERFDDDLIDTLTELYTGFMPNTYTFTKALAEQIIDDEKTNLPLVLFRPSIVISSMKEPFPGWVSLFATSVLFSMLSSNKNDLILFLLHNFVNLNRKFPQIDNFNGPVGLLVGSGVGIMRTMYCNPDNIADFTPVR
jgi:alcohol-forming fatty acyl-CoA reductase